MDRFSHYLRTNQAPSECEAQEIKELRANPLEEISRIDVEIEGLERTLDSLKRKRANIQKPIDKFNAVLSPIRRLPADIWGIIFTYCLATHRNPIMDGSEAPMLLTRICRNWRSFALSNPRLWSRFHVSVLHEKIETWGVPRDAVRRMETQSEEVQRWLKLSSPCPLSITISMPSAYSFHKPPLDAIIQSCRRWQTLELGHFNWDSNVWLMIANLSGDDLCMLRELRLHSMYDEEMPGDLWCEDGLMTAQGLRSISIGKLNNIDNLLQAGIPPNWKNLDHLSIHSFIPVGLAGQLLSHCCNLVTCDIIITPMPLPWSASYIYQPITLSSSSWCLPHLDRLSLKGDAITCDPLFRNIEAQSLQILHCNGKLSTAIERPGLLKFLQSISSLKTFMVDCEDMTGDNLLKCGAFIPSVTHLVLGCPIPTLAHHNSYPSWRFNTADFMTALYNSKHQHSPHFEPAILFPCLQVLEVYDIEMTDAALLELIIARIDAARSDTAVSKLRKIFIRSSRPRDIDIVPEALAYAQAAGIELELKLSYLAGPVYREWLPSFGLIDDGPPWPYHLPYFDI